jgi:hypothetical protein
MEKHNNYYSNSQLYPDLVYIKMTLGQRASCSMENKKNLIGKIVGT